MKKSALLACTILSVFVAGHASAYDPRNQRDMLPSIEINLDVLSNLNNPQVNIVPGSPEGVKGQDIMPFGQQSEADKKLMAKKHKQKHKKHKKKSVKKPVQKKVVKTDTAPEVRVVADHDRQSDDIPVLVQIPERDKTQPVPVTPGKTPGLEPLPQVPAQGLSLPPEKKVDLPVVQPMPQPVKIDKKPAPIQDLPMAAPAPVVPKAAPPLPPAPAGSAKNMPSLPSVSAPSVSHSADLPPLPSAPAAMPPVVPAPLPAMPGLPAAPGKNAELDMKDLEPVKKPDLPPVPAASGAAPALPSLPPMPGSKDAGVSAVAVLPPVPSKDVLPPAATPPVADATAGKKQADNAPAPDARITFNENETDIPAGSTAKLDGIAQQLIKHPDMRVSIMAYASGSDAISIYPKRVSLARGISVRNYLVTTKNIDLERVTVKALGNKNESGPGDRVDVFIIK